MTKTSILLLCAAWAAGAAEADGVLGSGTFTSNNFTVNYVTRAEPASPSVSVGGGFRYDGGLLHRVEFDNNAHTFFGYDLKVEPVPGTVQCRVTIGPLTQTAADIATWVNGSFDPSSRPVQSPKYPAPQLIDSGDTIALDVLVSPDGTQK